MTEQLLFHLSFHALEKEMATHSSVLAWRIPGTGEPGGLSSTGSHRVGHDWSDLAAAAAAGLSGQAQLSRTTYCKTLTIKTPQHLVFSSPSLHQNSFSFFFSFTYFLLFPFTWLCPLFQLPHHIIVCFPIPSFFSTLCSLVFFFFF